MNAHMHTRRLLLPLLLAAATLLPAAAAAQGHTFPYQGRLEQQGVAQSGPFQFTFTLYESSSGGTALWQSGVLDLVVHAGAFSAELGPVPETIFRKPALYLAVAVKGPGDSDFVALGGRQRILPIPFAVQAALGVPAGTIVAFGGATPPAGWLRCDGSSVSNVYYPDLHAAIGETYGQGDDGPGGDSFSLPNLQGRLPLGVGTVYDPGADADVTFDLGTVSGTVTHRLSEQEMPSHKHDVKLQEANNADGDSSCYDTGNECTTNSYRTNVSEYTGGGGAHTTLPPVVVVSYIIKT